MTDRVAIVSTSINAAPEAYAAWAQQGDLIVAGDKNSHSKLESYVRDVGGTYISPDAQEAWGFARALPWYSIQRRNVAVMYAYMHGYDFVATVDDDNHPPDNWVKEHLTHLHGELPDGTMLASGNDGWVDIGMFNRPPTKQRGTPFGVGNPVSLTPGHKKLVVSTAQVIGDPDCDAVSRLAWNPHVVGIAHNVVVGYASYAAFNSQATLWDGTWAPLIAVLPYVGRYDDIIASFIAKRIMWDHAVTLYAGEPCVTQQRNHHNVIEDLRNEIWGLENTMHIIDALESVELEPFCELTWAYEECTSALEHILPRDTIKFMRTWSTAWRTYHREEG